MTDSYNTWADGKEISTARLQDIVDHMGAVNNLGFRQEQASDYLVFKSGTNYYVRNGSDGTIESAATSTSSETALEWANTQLADKGGTITVKGLINLDAQFDMNVHGVTLQGTSRWLGRDDTAAGVPLTGLYLDANVDDDMIFITGSGCTVRDLFIYGNKANNAAGTGIRLADDANLRCHLENLNVYEAKTVGVYVDGGCDLRNVYVQDCDTNGFEVRASNVHLHGCTAKDNGADGFTVDASSQITRMDGCYSMGNGANGLTVMLGSNYTMVDNCVFYNNDDHGLSFGDNNNSVTDSLFVQNSQGTTNTKSHVYLDNNAPYCTVSNNQFNSPGASKVKYHIEEGTTVERCVITGNVFGSAAATDWALIYGELDLLANFTVPFFTGSVWAAKGWDVDQAAEYAMTMFTLPQGLRKVIWMKIMAYSVVTEADAMHLQVEIEAATDNEIVTTHTISKTDLNSASTNFSAGDIIFWNIAPADTTVLSGGDSVSLQCLYEGAAGDDCATDAHFRSVEVSYV